MSGFVAILHDDDSPVDAELLTRLTRWLAYRGPDGFGIWRDGRVGLGHTLFRSTFHCRHERQPLVHADGELALVADARIDERAQLCRELGDIGYAATADAPASALIMAAYRAWGEEAPSHLFGDFSFAIWDRRAQRLFAARDRFGLRALHYARFRHGWILSNEVRPILGHPSVPRHLDELALADFLLFFDVAAVDRRQTPFAAVRQVELAESLTIENGRCRLRPYWAFPTEASPLEYRREEEYGEHFRHVLGLAVEDRIQAPTVVAPMSGGLDSTTATALAAGLMREGRGPGALVALTAVADDADEEGRLAAEVARMAGIEHRTTTVHQGAPLGVWTPTPFPNAFVYQGHAAVHRLAAGLGRVSLHGSGGDYLFFPEPFTMMAQWRAAGVRDTLRALSTLRRVYGCRPPLGTGLMARLHGRPPPLEAVSQPSYAFPKWVAPAFREEWDLDERWKSYWERWPSPGHPLRPAAHRMIWDRASWPPHPEDWSVDYAPPDGADPFLDPRVIGFLFSLPPLPWFYGKHIIRTAMRGYLPPAVLRRPKVVAGSGAMPWQEVGSAFDQWAPSSPLDRIIARAQIPSLGLPLTPREDWNPFFLHLWLSRWEMSS